MAFSDGLALAAIVLVGEDMCILIQCYLISILNYSVVNGVDRRVGLDEKCLDRVEIYRYTF